MVTTAGPGPWSPRAVALAVAGSITLHAAVVTVAAHVKVRAPAAREEPAEIAFEVVPVPRPPAPPPAARPHPSRPREVVTRVATRPAPVPAPARTATLPLPLPPSSELPPPGAPPTRAVPRVGITLSSTAAGGSFAVGVGNTLYGKASEVAGDPTEARPYAAPSAPAPRTATGRGPSAQPKLLEQPEVPYPAEARHAGVDGRVILVLSIDPAGRVISARVLSEPGSGLGEAARQAALRFRFSPALDAGDPVPAEIRFTYTFVLE